MKKLLTYAVVISTIVWSMGLGALIPAASAAYAPVANDIVKVSNSSTGSSAVYIIKPDLKPYVFSTRNTYGSWLDDFSTLKYITQAEFDAMTLGGNVTVRTGNLIKFDNGASVYAVVPGNKLCKLPTADADAKALYGANYAARVLLVQVSFVGNYTVDAACAMTASSKLPDGTLIKYVSSSDIYYIENGLKRLVTNEAFLANGFKTANIVTDVATSMVYDAGTSITGKEAGLTTVTVTGATAPVTGGNLTVSLSASNPVAITVPEGAEVELLKANLAAGSKDVSVTGITVKRNSMTVEASIAELGIYVGATRYGSLKTTWNDDKTMTFNFPTPITVTAGNTVTITIKGKIGNDGSYAGVLINAATDVMTNGTVSGSFPVSGNLFPIASGVASASILLENSADEDINVNAGDSDVLLAGFDLTEDSNDEDVLLTGIAFMNGGTADSDAVRNLRLYVDGTEVGKAEMDGDTATFSFDAVTIDKGDTATVELKGDINNGEENTTLLFYVTKVTAVGKDLGFAAGTDITELDRKTDAGTNEITLGAGDVTIAFNKSATAGGTAAKDVRPETDDVELATLEMTSNDEDVIINSIDSAAATFRLTGNSLENDVLTNVRLKDTAGGTYDLTATHDGGTSYDLLLDEEIFLTKGVKKTFKVVADLTAQIDQDDTIKVELDADAIDHEGETSGSTNLTFTPNSITSALATVKLAFLTITNTQLTDVTVVPGAEKVLVYQGKLKAGASSKLSIKSLTLTTITDGSDVFTDDNISQLRLYINNVLVSTKSGAITETGGAGDTIAFTSLNAEVPANTEYVVKVEADFNSTFGSSGDVFALNIDDESDVIARDVDNNILDNGTQKNNVTNLASREVMLSDVGILTVDLFNDTNENWNKELYVLAGNGLPTGRSLAEIKFIAQNEDITVNEVKLEELGSADSSDIEKVELVDAAGTVVTSASFEEGVITLDTDFVVAKDSTKKLYVKVTARGQNVEGDPSSTADAGDTALFVINDVTATGVDTGEDIAMAGNPAPGDNQFDNADQTNTSTVMYVVLDSIANDTTGVSTALTGGNDQVIAKYSIVFNNKDNRDAENGEYSALLEELLLTVATSTNVGVTDVQAYIEGASGDKTTAAPLVGGVATIDFSTIEGESKWVSGAAKIVIIADITVDGADPEYLQTSIEDLTSDFTWDGGITNSGNSLLLDTTVQGTKVSRN